MDRIVAPNGSEINFETLVDSIQAKAFSNLKKRISEIFSSMGLSLTITNGVEGTEFQTTLISTNTVVSVSAGKALNVNGNYISIASSLTTDNLTTSNPNNGYAVVLTYSESGTTPVKAVNAFVFDKLGSASLNRKTIFSDSTSLALVQITSDLTTLKASLTAEQIVIAAVWDSTGTFDSTAAGLSSYDTTSSGDYRVTDLRKDTRLLFSTNLIDDNIVLFKDRPSTGTNKFNQNIEFGLDVDISGTLTLSSGVDYTVTPDSNTVSISSSTGEHLKLLQESSTSKVRVPYLETTTLKVLTGGEYRDVVTAGPASTLPRNLRIYDIYPTEDPNEKKGYVEIRWNWDDLTVDSTTTTTVTIDKTSYNNETISFTASDLSTYLPGKRIYFVGSANYYEIASVVDDGSTYTITIASGDVSAESTSSSEPMRIVDKDVEVYRLRFRSSSQQGRTNKELIAVDLTTDFVANPYYTQKLELGRDWYVTIQAQNNNYLSSVVTMAAGSYDPDHQSGGQAVVNYGSPFSMSLPSLEENGSVTLTADKQGFSVGVSGWNGGDNQSRAHEYEILYSDSVTINSSTFTTVPLPSNVQRIVTGGSYLHIASAVPTRYSVAVRPLQNKQGVDTPIISEVVSGGGGVAPTNQILFEDNVNLLTTKFIITEPIENTNKLAVKAYSPTTGEQEQLIYPSFVGKKATFPTQTADLITLEGTDNVTYGVGNGSSVNITPSFVAASSPEPSHIKFALSAATNDTTNENDEDYWGYVIPNAATAVESQETITFTATVAMHNWGHAKASLYLKNDVTGEILDSYKIEKVADIYATTRFVKNVALSWTNDTASNVSVSYEIRGWGNMEGGASHDNLNVIHILRDFASPGKGYTQITSGTYSNFPVDFRSSYYKMQLRVDNSISEENTHYDIVNFYGLGSEPDRHIYSNGFYIIELSSLPSGLVAGDEFYVGVTPQGRFISTKSLDVDYKITSLEFQPYFVQDASAATPGIIRVYANDSTNSAVNLEVEGASSIPIKVQTNLDVKLSENSRTFTIDGFDASALPNNRAEINGKLVVLGRPIIKDNIENS